MRDNRTTKRIAQWSYSLFIKKRNSWFCYTIDILNNCDIVISIFLLIKNMLIVKAESVLQSKYLLDGNQTITSDVGSSRKGGNKLRTYSLFKSSFCVEKYCTLIMPTSHRAAFSKFRCGVAPIRIETGRYEGLPTYDLICPFCNLVEDEMHVLMDCDLYADLRQTLIDRAIKLCPVFIYTSKTEQLKFVFTNSDMIRICAKTCYDILQRRLFYLNK